VDRLSAQCLAIKNESSGGLLAVEQRLQALRNEYDRRLGDVEKLRRDNQAAFAQQLEVLINCKHQSFHSLALADDVQLQTKVIWSIGSRMFEEKSSSRSQFSLLS
jgi:hypothetical protein